MFTITKSPWLLATLLFVCLAAPGQAAASSSQLSLIQDDRELLGLSGKDPAAAMAETRSLGADIVRTNVIYGKVYRDVQPAHQATGLPHQRPQLRALRLVGHRPARFARRRQRHPGAADDHRAPGPFFSSTSPRRCRTGRPCTYRPKVAEFGGSSPRRSSATAVAWPTTRIYNEPNLGKTWLTPRFQRSRSGRIDVAGAIYRKLWIAGYKAIAKYDPARRNRVLFGEVAAIASPLPDAARRRCASTRRGRPFRGRLAKLQGCAGRVTKLNIGGVAVHPYNVGGNGTPQTRTRLKTVLHLAYLPRLHRLMDGAARTGAWPAARASSSPSSATSPIPRTASPTCRPASRRATSTSRIACSSAIGESGPWPSTRSATCPRRTSSTPA